MESKKITSYKLVLVLILYGWTSIQVFAQGLVTYDPNGNNTAAVMQVMEVEFTSQGSYTNPYLEVDVWIDLKKVGGTAEENYRIPVFWNGGNEFRARLVATSVGVWDWDISDGTGANGNGAVTTNNIGYLDQAFNGVSGSFTATQAADPIVSNNDNNRGFIRVADNNRTLEYANGDSFFYTADTSWAILTDVFDYSTSNGVSGISFKDYILGTNTITGRKEQGYNGLNVISSFPSEKFAGIWGGTAGLKSGNGAWPFELINSETDVDYLRINPAYWQSVDERMQFLADEGFVTLFETVRRSERWRDGTQAEKDAFYNYVRYLWARYGCYNMIFSWVHHDSQSSIYPQWRPLVEDAHDELSDQLGDRMPYGQPRTAMFFGSTLDSWEKDIPDAIDVQSVSNDERDETMHEWLSEAYHDWDKHHTLGGPKPALNLEPFYPGWGSHSSNEINPGLDATTMAQMQMYGSVLSGGLAGHAWGDGWHAGEGYSAIPGVNDTGQINALTSYESQAMGHLKSFILDADHEYHKLKPAAHTNLNSNQNYVQTLSISDDKKFALGFLTTSYNVPNLTNLLPSEPYRFEWWDVTNGVWINAGNSTTNGSGQLVPPSRPDNSKNWAYRIRTLDYDPNPNSNFVLRVNSGGSSSATYQSNTFVADNQSGYTYSASTLITNGSSSFTLAQPFKSVRYTKQSQMEYLIPVSNGDYEVILHFAEPYHGVHPGTDPTTRKFHVDIEGTRIETDLNIMSEVGANQVYTINHTASVSDGQLNLTFLKGSGNDPIINAFEVLEIENDPPIVNAGSDQTITLPTNSIQLSGSGSDPDGGTVTFSWTQNSGPSTVSISGATSTTPTVSNLLEGTYVFELAVTDDESDTTSDTVTVTVNPEPGDFVLRVNSGGSSSATYQGNIFVADNQSGYTYSASTLITNGSSSFTLAQPFKSVRYTKQSQMEYLIPVSNGDYEVILHFAEPYHGVHPGTDPTTRKFHVDVEGTRIETDLNIMSEVGANQVYTINHTASVSDGQLNLTFLKGSGNDPIINAFEVLEIGNAGPNGLVGHWPLDEQSGTTAGDVSSQAYDGTLVNGISFDNDSGNGQIGDALIFDGTDDQINLPDIDNNLQAGFSVSAWINPQSTSGYTAIAGTHTSQGFMTFVQNGKLGFALRTDTGTRILQGHGTILTNQWQHIAVTYDGSAMKWYVNGVEEASVPHSGQVVDRNNGYIGWSGWSNEYFNGAIDDVKIFDNSLTLSQIQDLAMQNPPSLPDTAGHWPLDEQSGTTANDISGQGLNGTLINGLDFSSDNTGGQVGSALSFDGINDQINLPDIDNNLQAGFSVSAWINPQSTSGYTAIAGTHTSQGFMTFVQNGKLGFALRTDTGTRILQGHGTILTNQWQHIAVTYDGSAMKWYVNGIEEASVPHSGQVVGRNNGYIGWSGWSSEYFDGIIDDVRLYEIALTSTQVSSLFQNGGGSTNLSVRADLSADETGIGFILPNPTKDRFRITGLPKGTREIVVSDFSSRVLIASKTDKEEHELDLSAFPEGIYIVKVLQNGSEWTFKVVKE